MKIMMQVPYTGTELETAHERRKQASQTISYSVKHEFDSRKTLATNNCDSAPRLVYYKQEKQDAGDIIAGGWIIYMVIEQAPGVPLGHMDFTLKTHFWSSPAQVRKEIRAAFRTAWEECVNVGVLPQEGDLDDLSRDSNSKKVYINSFVKAMGANVNVTWNNLNYLAWDLMRSSWVPKGRDDYIYSAHNKWVI